MEEVLPQDWNTRLRRERERRGWTRAQLAGHLKVGESSIYGWEEKAHKPRAETLQALIRLFGKPVEAWGKNLWHVPYLRNLYFTGRKHTLKRLHDYLRGPALSGREIAPVALSQTQAISGLGGIGKTQTALQYAYDHGDEYDLVLWVRADSRETLVAQFAALAPLLGLPTYAETNQHRLAEAVKRHLETEQEQVWLLILDNVEDILLVKEFLPEKGNGAVLLTTRLHGVGKSIHKIELDTLTLEESLQFFQKRLGRGEEPEQKVLSAPERQAATHLHELLGGLPLALEQAAAYIEDQDTCSLVAYVDLYQQQREALLQLPNRIDRDYPDSVATTWIVSFQRVQDTNPDAVALLYLCAFLHPDAIPEEMLQTVVEDAQRLQAAIESLQHYSLVQHQPKSSVLSIHRLVQAVIQDRLEEAEQHAWREQAMLAVNTNFPDPELGAWEQCERLLPHALLAAHYIEQDSLGSEEAGRLLHETASYLSLRARYTEGESLFQRALQIREHLFGPEHLAVADTLTRLAQLLNENGEFDTVESIAKRALHIYQQHPGHLGEAAACNSLGTLFVYHSKFHEAEMFLQRAIELYEQKRYSGIWKPLSNLAVAYQYQEKYEQAELFYERALKVMETQELKDPRRAYILNNLGTLYKERGRYDRAEPLLQQSREIGEQRFGPDHHGVAYTLTALGDLYRLQKKYPEAEELLLRALDICEHVPPEQQHPDVARPLNHLAMLHRDQGNYAKAALLFQRALTIMGLEHVIALEILQEFARSQELWGKYEEAYALYTRAYAACQKAFGEEAPKTAETRARLAALLKVMGRAEEAAQLEMAPAELSEDERRDLPQPGPASGQDSSEHP